MTTPPVLFERLVSGETVPLELHDVGPGRAAAVTAQSSDKETGNEDGFLLLTIDPDRALLAVADGLGGHHAGATASRLALERIARSVRETAASEEHLRGGILDGFEAANEEILALGIGAGTTLAVVEIAGGHFRHYHVGDSSILQMGQRGRLKVQTIMHSPTGYAVESGLLSEKAALDHEERHIVSNIVGCRGMRIDIGSVHPIAPRDTILVATDGLYDNLDPRAIVEILRKGPLPAATTELVARCRERMASGGKPDDLTVLAWRPGVSGASAS